MVQNFANIERQSKFHFHLRLSNVVFMSAYTNMLPKYAISLKTCDLFEITLTELRALTL